MKIVLRTSALFPLIFYAALGFALSRSLGHYRLEFVLGVALLWAFSTVGFFVDKKTKAAAEDRLGFVCHLVLMILLFRVMMKPLLLEPIRGPWFFILRGFLLLAGLGGLGLFLEKTQKAGLVLLALGLVVARFLVPIVSPEPTIDVFVNSSLAVSNLFKGLHPYAVPYPDLYEGASGYVPGYLYPPGVFLFTVPGALFGDIRFGLALADIGAAILVGYLAVKKKVRLGPISPWIFSMLWLSFPVCLFLLERSFVDSALIFWVDCLLLAWIARKWTLAAVFCGLALISKQYAIFLLPFCLIVIGSKEGMKVALRFAGIACLTAGLVLLPFLVTDFAATWNSLVRMPLSQPMRPDSFSLVAVLFHYEKEFPSMAMLGVYVLGFVAVSYRLAKKAATSPGMAAWAQALVVLYGLVFLFGKQAFANYYQLLAHFLLLQLLFLFSESADGARD